MIDPYDPTDEEIREWAYGSPPTMEPVQDFDLMVATSERLPLLLELAADSACPSHDWFLHCLYLVVGDAVRTNFRTCLRSQVEAYVALGGLSSAPTVQRWAERTDALLASPESFSYDAWCAGGLAYERPAG